MDETKLQALENEHIKLVEQLKKTLIAGQTSFLLAGALLYKIKKKKTFRKVENLTWKEFCSSPDIPLPGSTPESRRRIADALIRIHQVFVLKLRLNQPKLARIGWTKLDMIAPVCSEEKDAEKREYWLTNAEILNATDLALALKERDEKAYEKLKCLHENEYPQWKCPDCGATSRNPMNKAHKPIPEHIWKGKSAYERKRRRLYHELRKQGLYSMHLSDRFRKEKEEIKKVEIPTRVYSEEQKKESWINKIKYGSQNILRHLWKGNRS